MSLIRRLDDVSSFMSTVDLFADSPQGGVGGKDNSQRTWRMAGAMSPSCHNPQGGVGGKETFLGGEGGLNPGTYIRMNLQGLARFKNAIFVEYPYTMSF